MRVVIIGMMLWEQEIPDKFAEILSDRELITWCREQHPEPLEDATWTMERLP
jgi:hypothetical protein